MPSEFALIKQGLANRYARTTGPVAFIDETYRINNFDDEENFYLVAGILVDSSLLHDRRQEFLRLVGSNYWHTTEAFAERNHSKIREFLRLLSSTKDLQVFTVRVSVDANETEHARRVCLTQILKTLESHDVRTAVIERRKLLGDRRSDEALFKKAIASGVISRKLEVLQSTPAAEQLLWAADLVCWSLRRFLALNDAEWVRIIHTNLLRIEPGSQSALKTKKPEPAAAKGPGHESAAVPRDAGRNRSSIEILPAKDDIEQRVLQLFSRSDSESIPIDVLDDWLASEFPRQRN